MRGLGVVSTVLVLLIAASGCSGGEESPEPRPATNETSAGSVIDRSDDLVAVEQTHDVRLGVCALDTGSGDSVEHRPDERFAFASTIKAFLVGALLEQESTRVLEQEVPISTDDLEEYAPTVKDALAQGRTTMTVGELADGAVRFSDNAAANPLLGLVGGPPGLQEALRATGDDVTSSSRTEPELNEAVPGDDRDTSTPRAMVATLEHYTLGEADQGARDTLLDLMRRNTTGDAVIRAGVPAGWEVADKTGSASYGTRNDIAVVWPPGGAPIVVAILTSRDAQDAGTVDAAIADAMAIVAEALS
ncbi:class A beta-lactamase [Aeromicrobium sp. Sec7.5]|uniref:class A beta-lactamase n=1 Tax=Aeromicrobium sp. Sec7.5 TaxID=3121276 RepID=UPI002FE465A4